MRARIPPLLLIAEGKKARPRRQAAFKPLEQTLHIQVVSTLKAFCRPDWQWTHFPAGEKRSVITGARLKRMGLRKGWPDFQLVSPYGVFHGLEIKRRGQKPTDEQKLFRDWAREGD